MSNRGNNSSSFREGIRVYKQRKPPRVPSKKEISKGGWKSTLKSVVDATKFVMSLVNTENKICDTLQVLRPNTLGSVFPISLMAQGTDIVQRIGVEIHPHQLDIRVSAEIAGSTTPVCVRLIVFRDRNCSGSTPSVSDVLTVISPPCLSHYNVLNFQGDDLPRFDFLVDELFTLAPNSDQNQPFLRTLKFNDTADQHIHYLGSSAVTSSLGKNNLFALVISDGAAGATAPGLNWNSRLNYASF